MVSAVTSGAPRLGWRSRNVVNGWAVVSAEGFVSLLGRRKNFTA